MAFRILGKGGRANVILFSVDAQDLKKAEREIREGNTPYIVRILFKKSEWERATKMLEAAASLFREREAMGFFFYFNGSKFLIVPWIGVEKEGGITLLFPHNKPSPIHLFAKFSPKHLSWVLPYDGGRRE